MVSDCCIGKGFTTPIPSASLSLTDTHSFVSIWRSETRLVLQIFQTTAYGEQILFQGNSPEIMGKKVNTELHPAVAVSCGEVLHGEEFLDADK